MERQYALIATSYPKIFLRRSALGWDANVEPPQCAGTKKSKSEKCAMAIVHPPVMIATCVRSMEQRGERRHAIWLARTCVSQAARAGMGAVQRVVDSRRIWIA